MVTGFEFSTGTHFCTVYSFTLPLMSSSSVFKDYIITSPLYKKNTTSNTWHIVLIKQIFFFETSMARENLKSCKGEGRGCVDQISNSITEILSNRYSALHPTAQFPQYVGTQKICCDCCEI